MQLPSQAKGHVPNENLPRYRRLVHLARQLESAGNAIGPNDTADSTILWRMAAKYRNKAQELRVDLTPGGGNGTA